MARQVNIENNTNLEILTLIKFIHLLDTTFIEYVQLSRTCE